MCLVAVYVKQPDSPEERRLVFSEAAFIECGENEVIVRDLLGQSEKLKARVRAIDLLKNEILLEQDRSRD